MKCSLCGGEKVITIHKGVRDNKNIDVYRCTQCGLVFLSEFDQITDNFYLNGGMHQETTTKQNFHNWRQQTVKDDERRGADSSIIEAKSICDFGCGNGGFLQQLQKNGKTEVCGVELEKKARDFLSAENIEVKEDIDEYDRKFDCITMFHVIEHLTDPIHYLTTIKKHLSVNGKLIIETPNADDALLTLYQSNDFANFTYWSCHVFLYTVRTLQMLMEQNGFTVIKRKQIQRYPLANHLYWLSQGKPGGQILWKELSNVELDAAYAERLAALGKCDTIWLECVKNDL